MTAAPAHTGLFTYVLMHVLIYFAQACLNLSVPLGKMQPIRPTQT